MRWSIGERSPEAELRLAQTLGLPPLVAAALVSRGLDDPDAARVFLDPSLDALGDPALLPDYRPAADRLMAARERGELVFVHGDYDVDGVTSTALFGRFLEKGGWRVMVHVPHRMKEGYGIHRMAVDAAADAGAAVFLTCDCGVAAHEQVAYAKERGMDVIVTDHHHVPEILPGAVAVINPHRSDSKYPFDELAGVGVVFRFCEGLTREIGASVPAYRDAYLDLAALGTIADVMPLIGENRIIARAGLERLGRTKKKGLLALMKLAKVKFEPDGALAARSVGWGLGPRLNAAGRIDDAAKSLALLLTREDDEADALANELEELNRVRRERQDLALLQADEIVLRDGLDAHKVLIVVGEEWHGGIVGIVAGRLAERYHRPAFVLRHDPETGFVGGSARSIPAFHLAEAIAAHPELLAGGGHAAAAGCRFPYEKLGEVRAALNAWADARLTPADMEPVLEADFTVRPEEIDVRALDELSRLRPFGAANPSLRLHSAAVPIRSAEPTRDGKHLRLVLDDRARTTAMGWGMGHRASEFAGTAAIDAVFEPSVNEWNGRRSPQWILNDARPA